MSVETSVFYTVLCLFCRSRWSPDDIIAATQVRRTGDCVFIDDLECIDDWYDLGEGTSDFRRVGLIALTFLLPSI